MVGSVLFDEPYRAGEGPWGPKGLPSGSLCEAPAGTGPGRVGRQAEAPQV